MAKTTQILDLVGKHAVVTGAANGIGLATAHALASAGAFVLMSDIDAKRGSAATDAVNDAYPNRAAFLSCDVSSEESCARFWTTLEKEFPEVDILVNAAGVTVRADVTTLSLAQWDKVIATNLTSVFLMSRAAIPLMQQRGGGTIINIASGWGLVGGAQAAAYCASKGGVVLLTKSMAIDHGPDGIRVNCICPGDTDTGMLTSEARQLNLRDDALLEAAKDRPLQRVGKPQEIANTVLFLASDMASFTTGEAMVVDGGGLAGSA